jgi:predicted nucleotidyltransferase component of viral defense system
MKKPTTNLAHSIRDRLLRAAKVNGEEFTYALTRYALERLLARLAASMHAGKFILKGAMLFRVWSPTLHRPTKDLDLLGSGAPDLGRLAKVFADICGVPVEDDGILFDAQTVRAERIKEDADYEGVRVTLRAMLGSARMDLQIDVGFGDAISPGTVEVEFPTMLGMASPRLRAYPKETVVAEKLQAMVHLGIANSRMKDFFDLWFLSQSFAFDGVTLATAIAATFARRLTPLPEALPLALTADFSLDESKQKQWKAFRTRAGVTEQTLDAVVKALVPFLGPALAAARAPTIFSTAWAPPAGPWATAKGGA